MRSSAPEEQQLSKVRVEVNTMELPTAGMGFDNPNTLFVETGGYLQDATYPCAFHNHFLREKLVAKEYKRITFENDYLLVEFAPDLGGRVWRLYDKVHGEDIIHHNDCAKPYPGGFGGAYCAGGIELNYPFAHSVTNTWPRKTEFVENEDGSATYTVSEWERNGRTQWAMSFTLMPNEAKLRQRVTLYNRSKLPVSYMYWGNAGVPAEIDTKWIYRETMGSEHGGDTVYYWPESAGIDLSVYKDDCEVVGIYFLDPKYNFFGLTNQKTLSGLAHFGHTYDLPGKKLWTWGRNASGENRMYHLCDKPECYGEVQSGRPLNQEHLEWLMPEEYLAWDEQWSPIHGLSDVTEVTEDCAFQIVADEKKVLCYPFVDINGQTLRITLDGKVIRELIFDGKVTELKSIDVSDIATEDMARLDVKIIKANELVGSISLAERCERKPAREIMEEPIFNESSSISLFINAEFSQKLMYNKKALLYYQRAVELDDMNYKAHIGLGRMLYIQADFEGAKASFHKAIGAYKWDTESYIMLAHIYQQEGNLDAALENAFSARYYGDRCRSNIKVGEVYIGKGEYSSALKFLTEAKDSNRLSLRTYALSAICERKLGKADAAKDRLEETPAVALKDLLWYSEKYFLGLISESELVTELFDDEWRFLELGLNYADLGLYDDAEKILNIGISLRKSGWPMHNLFNPERIYGLFRQRETPFLHILKGYIAARSGRTADAAKFFSDGDYFEYYVNANQPELIPAIEKAIENGNANANHYLGNFMFHYVRHDDAVKLWREADAKTPKNSVNVRNLAVYAKFIENDIDKACVLLREALALNPYELYVRQELVDTERARGASAQEILDIYLAAPEIQKATITFMPLLTAYMAAEKFADAAEFLSKVDRQYCDEDSGWYNFAISYADFLVDGGKPEEALEWIKRSRPNPRNLSYINYTEEVIAFHKEHYVAGIAYKMMGNTAEAEKSFKKAIEQPTDWYYFKPMENYSNLLRFYVALAMKELGLEVPARSMLGGVNTYRDGQALMRLTLKKSEVKRWGEIDPNSLVSAKKHIGPEI